MTTHQNAIRLVDQDGRITPEGAKLFLDTSLTKAQREAIKEQALLQEIYGTGETRDQAIERRRSEHVDPIFPTKESEGLRDSIAAAHAGKFREMKK